MRISDWSSDVCSSDLGRSSATRTKCVTQAMWDDLKIRINDSNIGIGVRNYTAAELNALDGGRRSEERRVGTECVSRVDLGGGRIIKKKNNTKIENIKVIHTKCMIQNELSIIIN